MTEKKYELRKQIKSVRWMIFWVVLAQFAAELVVDAVFSFMENPPYEYIRVAIVEILAIGVPITVYARSAWSSGIDAAKQQFWLKPCKPYCLLLAALVGIFGQFVMIVLNIPGNLLVQEVLKQSPEDVIPVVLGGGKMISGIIALVIIPAILEEFWMRGIIFSAYNKSNTVVAIFLTSVLFALLHLKISDALGFLFMGIVASVVLIKCNSIYAAMVYHGFSNLTALLLEGFVLPYIGDYIWTVLALTVLGFVVLFGLLLVQKNKILLHRNFKTGTLVLSSIFSLPIMLSIVVVIVKYFLIKAIG